MLFVVLVALGGNARASTPPAHDQLALVFVDIHPAGTLSRFAATNLPMYIILVDGLLTGADLAGQQLLHDAGLSYTVLDPHLGTGSYYFAETRSSRPVPDFAMFGQVLLRTASSVLLRMDPSKVDTLAQAGAELSAITLTPKPLPTIQLQDSYPKGIESDPIIQNMIDQVSETEVYTYERQLAGELPVEIGDSSTFITSRNTYSGASIQKATQFVGQHLQELGMEVEYHQWEGVTYPNVIGEIHGSVDSDDIYIIGSHLDDISMSPGADDNASGSVATLVADDILSQYPWGCTLRFAFWIGEEQGLRGSAAYARRSFQSGENIRAVLNLDMIAFNTTESLPDIDVMYYPGMPSTYILSQLFSDVINTYGINLIPELVTSIRGTSDQASFLTYGFPAILAIEDQSDFNPYYHSPNDTPAHTDPGYFTNYVRAAVGSYAHMTSCLLPSNYGTVEGYVTSSTNASPITGARLTAKNSLGDRYSTVTDTIGYYTMTLPAGTFSVTASANGYVSAQTNGVTVTPSLSTLLDFSLDPGCDPLTNLDFSWQPSLPFNGDEITFTASAIGIQPIDYAWDFGDGTTDADGEVVTHMYALAGTYPVVLTAVNACDPAQVSHAIVVLPRPGIFYLPLVIK